jgi:hypothetical protein
MNRLSHIHTTFIPLCVFVSFILGVTTAVSQTFTLTGGNITITVNAGTVDGLTAVPNSSCRITYQERFGITEKITVATTVNPAWTLQVDATNPTIGTDQGVKTLSTTAQDFVRDIPSGFATGTVTLAYTLAPTYGQGTTTSTSYRVTYTLTTQ